MNPIYLMTASCLALALVASPATATEDHAQTPPGQSSQLTTMRVDQITDTKVVNEGGEEIGVVDSVVRDKTTNQLQTVVSIGGFLGIGDHKVTIALQDLTMRGDRLAAPAGTSRDQLKNLPEYQESPRYETLTDDRVVSIGGSSTDRSGQKGGSPP